jgi:hypothetical protein
MSKVLLLPVKKKVLLEWPVNFISSSVYRGCGCFFIGWVSGKKEDLPDLVWWKRELFLMRPLCLGKDNTG